MKNKNPIILFCLLAIIGLIILGGYFVYIFLQNKSEKEKIEEMLRDARRRGQQGLEQMKKDYEDYFPDLIVGVIDIISDEKTIIKSQDGVEYSVSGSPARPMSFFKDSGINNGDMVEVRGRLLENNYLSLGSIIKKE